MNPFYKIISMFSLLIFVAFPAGNLGRAYGPADVQAAAASSSLDGGFAPVFVDPGEVRGILPLAEGKVLVYGSLTSVNGIPRNQVAILNGDGTLDSSFTLDPALNNGEVFAVAGAAGGKFLIGGSIRWFGPTHYQAHLFRVNADGSLDPTFDAGGFNPPSGSYGLDGQVTALKVDGNGKILVGGDFTSPYNHITRLLASGAPDPSFNPGTGTDGRVTHIDLQSSGKIILGGDFSQVNGTASSGVARLGVNGAFESAFFGSGVSGYSTGSVASGVSALAVQSNDDVLVGGGFASIRGVGAPILARIKADGTLDTGFVPFVRGYLEEVTSLLVVGSQVVVGGWNPVMYFGGWPTDHNAEIFVLQSTNGGFVGYTPFNGKPTDVLALAKRSDGKVMAGGNFIVTDEPSPQYFAGLFLFTASPYSPDLSFRPIVGSQATVSSLAVQKSDGQILAAGRFYRVNGEPNNGLARLNSQGALDGSFSPDGHDFTAVSIRSDQKIAAEQYDGALVLFNPDGSVNAMAGIGMATFLTSQPDLKVIAATNHAPGVGRYNSNLSEDTAFSTNRGSGISNAIQPDGELDRVDVVALQGNKIIAGGSFTTFSGIGHQNLLRLNANGSVDNTFTPPAFTVFNFRSEVFALAVQKDGRILVGGRFSTVGGVAHPSLVRLNANGTVDSTFQSPFLDQGLNVYALALQPDGKILVGGNVQIIEAANVYNSLVRLNPDGSRDASFSANVSGTVKTLAFVSPNQLLMGGSFSLVDGQPRFGMARYFIPDAFNWKQIFLPLIVK